MEEFHYSEKESKICCGLSNPESEHPLGETRLQLLQLHIRVLESETHFRAQLRDATVEFRLQLGNALLELCVEPRVIRSEERRVGKGCRCEWAADQYDKRVV